MARKMNKITSILTVRVFIGVVIVENYYTIVNLPVTKNNEIRRIIL